MPAPRVRARAALLIALAAALVATLALVGLPLLQPSSTSAVNAAPAVASPMPTVIPDAAVTRSLTSTEAVTRTPEQLRADRERSLRATRMARVAQLRVRIVDVARKQIGDRYRAGHSGPDAFDCSGFTRFVYKQATGKDLPHSSRAQWAKVKRIKKSQARPGDLVFFFENGEHHVGIYIGRNRMIDAPGVGDKVRVSPITGSWWGRSYTGMGRLLPA